MLSEISLTKEDKCRYDITYMWNQSEKGGTTLPDIENRQLVTRVRG